jgi:CHAT domain-containing protein/tetratricopeptide (TPR) repeat protein
MEKMRFHILKAFCGLVLLICSLSVGAENIGFLGLSMDQSFASYRRALEAKGFVYFAKVDGYIMFQGDYMGHKEVQVLVQEASTQRAITDVFVRIPNIRNQEAQQLFNQFTDEFRRQYGQPLTATKGESAFWQAGPYIVGAQITKGEFVLVYMLQGEDKENDFKLTTEAEREIRQSVEKDRFLGISTRLNLNDFGVELEEKGFILKEEDETSKYYSGVVAGIGQTIVAVSTLADQQTISYVMYYFPANPTAKEAQSFFARVRGLMIEQHGEPSYEKKEEFTAVWFEKGQSVTLFFADENQVGVMAIYEHNGESRGDIEEKAKTSEPTNAYVTRMVNAINEGRYQAAATEAEKIYHIAGITATPQPDIDRMIAYIQWLRTAHLENENSVVLRAARVMQLQCRKETERKNYIDAELWGNFADMLYQPLLCKKHPWRQEMEQDHQAFFNPSSLAKSEQPLAAITYYQHSVQIAKMLRGPRSCEYCKELFDMGVAYNQLGDFDKAEQCCKQAFDLGDVCDMPIVYILMLRNIANIYSQNGKYQEAEETDARLRQEVAKLYDSQNSDEYIQALHGMAVQAITLGDYEQGDLYLDQEMKALRNIHPEEPYIQYALAYLGKAAVYMRHTKQYNQALGYAKKALNNVVSDNPLHDKIYEFKCYEMISAIYAEMEDFDQAITYARKAMNIAKEVYSDRHAEYAKTLTYMAYALYKKKDYARAIEYDLQALRIYQDRLGNDHPSVRALLFNIGGAYTHLKQYDQAESYLRQAVEATKKNYLTALNFMSEHQREKYWEESKDIFEHEELPTFIYHTYMSRPSAAKFAYDNELFTKGLLLTSSTIVRRSIQESGDPQLVTDYAELSRLKNAINTLEQNGNAPEQVKTYAHRADSLEKSITKRSAAFRQNENLWHINWQNVRDHLSPDQVAIEFTRLPIAKDTVQYAALLLRKESKQPVFVPLFEEKQIESEYPHIWSKLQPYLQGINRICFSPVGGLHQLPIEYAAYDSLSIWADHYQMIRLSSTRELAIEHTPVSSSSAALFGGIYYDVDLDVIMAQSETYRHSGVRATRSMVDESLRAGVRYLPGTKREVEDIQAILQPQHVSTELFSTTVANEEAFKALNGEKRNIIHIATHGFYWSEDNAHKQKYFSGQTATIDPLNRSGLLFAGANLALRGHSDELPNDVQDGILTAKEISLMDLREADMVVLSACETAKGEVTGEGVFGLQRAFKMAGVQTILMSLWPVDDAATQLMMTEFYRHWIGNKEPKREAFAQAQKIVKQQYADPKYWAAFILLD